jgi:hypothetical protein
MINGSEAHAAMYSTSVHTVAVGDTVPMDYSQYAVNIVFNPIDNSLTVQRDGLYFFAYNIQFDQPCQLAVFVNDVADITAIAGNNSGATTTVGQQLLRLNAGDKVDLRNWKSNSSITTSFPAAGDLTLPTTNADFTLFKIAPLVTKCGEVPVPFPTPTCQDCEQEPHTPPHSPHPHPHPHHDSPKKCHSKDKKSEKKFKKLDKNDDGMLSYEEYKKQCERRHRHPRH